MIDLAFFVYNNEKYFVGLDRAIALRKALWSIGIDPLFLDIETSTIRLQLHDCSDTDARRSHFQHWPNQ